MAEQYVTCPICERVYDPYVGKCGCPYCLGTVCGLCGEPLLISERAVTGQKGLVHERCYIKQRPGVATGQGGEQ